MKLHLDRNAFDVFIENIHERCSYRSDVLEKDYYVVLILEELAKFQKENGLPAYFKGGTAFVLRRKWNGGMVFRMYCRRISHFLGKRYRIKMYVMRMKKCFGSM